MRKGARPTLPRIGLNGTPAYVSTRYTFRDKPESRLNRRTAPSCPTSHGPVATSPSRPWTDRLAVRLGEKIPQVQATRRVRTATVVYRNRSATIVEWHPTWFVNFSAPVAGLAIDRFDNFTARTVARSLAGYFVDGWSKPD
jgi:hypothetical protein